MTTSIQQLVRTRETIGSLWILVGLIGLVAPVIALFAAGGYRVDYFVGGFSLFAISMVVSGMTAPWMFPGLATGPGNSKPSHIVASVLSIFVALMLVGAIVSKISTVRYLITRLDTLAAADGIGEAERDILRDYATCLKSEYAESVLFADVGTQSTVRCGGAMLPGHGPGAMNRLDQLLR